MLDPRFEIYSKPQELNDDHNIYWSSKLEKCFEIEVVLLKAN